MNTEANQITGTERGRAVSVSNSNAIDRLRRSVQHDSMMRLVAIFLGLMLVNGCNRQSSGSRSVAINTVESVESRQVIYDGVPWMEVTISQRVDPKAPAYVVGIRDSKWANRLGWALVEQSIGHDRVISRFRLHPVGQTNTITLSRDDFEWYPRVSGFQSVKVALKVGPDGADNTHRAGQ